jgi:hypothetical protein
MIFNVFVRSLHEDLGEDPKIFSPRYFHIDYKISMTLAYYVYTKFHPR